MHVESGEAGQLQSHFFKAISGINERSKINRHAGISAFKNCSSVKKSGIAVGAPLYLLVNKS